MSIWVAPGQAREEAVNIGKRRKGERKKDKLDVTSMLLSLLGVTFLAILPTG
jgi:hypothetical protein